MDDELAKTIFISYSHQNKAIADEIENQFSQYGVGLRRDIRVVKYKDSFKQFMKEIRKADYVIMIISDFFLRSHNCMYEVIEFIKDENYKDRILPIIYEAKIYTELGKIDYIKYWNAKYREIENEVSGLTSEQTISIAQNQKIFREVSTNIGDFIEFIRDLNHKSYEDLVSSNFEELFEILSIEKTTPSENSINELIRLAERFKLNQLSLRHHDLKLIPDQVFKLKNLEILELGYNSIKEISSNISTLKNLKFLDLSNNSIKELPKEIISLENLGKILVENNPLERPPLPIASKGIVAIKEYFKSLVNIIKIYEAKIILIGEGNAGKTSLLKRIISNSYVDSLAETYGINITDWNFKTIENTSFKVNFFDFGGQEIYHATHQFFFSNRSLYIYVLDSRHEVNFNDYQYWLSLISLLSNDSPVIIVQNKIDIGDKEIPLDDLKNRYPNIVKSLKVSSVTGFGIGELKEVIKDEVSKLPHVGADIPKDWYVIRNHLEIMEESYISFQEYLDLCLAQGIKRNDALSLSQYLHDLGIILHFQDDNQLKEIIVLKPDWVTNAVYLLIDSKEIINNYGEFSLDYIESIWKTYPQNTHTFILEFLFKFDLCFQIPGTDKFIVPQLISYEEPIIDNIFKDGIKFEFRYDYLPSFIISRFIVRTFDLQQLNQRWRHGVVLKIKDSLAIVKLVAYENKISISLVGEDSKRLLYRIRNEFLNINESYKNLKYTEYIGCNCISCKNDMKPHYFNLKYIKAAFEKNKDNIFCEKSFENVNIIELINSYSNLVIE